MRRGKGFFSILTRHVGQQSTVQYHFHFHDYCKQFLIGKGCTADSLLQTSLNRSDKSFKYATPPRGLFKVERPLHPCIGKVLFNTRVVHQFHQFISFVISRAADLKVFPLSDTINSGVPRRAENLPRLLINAEAVRLGTRSKWIALVTQQV